MTRGTGGSLQWIVSTARSGLILLTHSHTYSSSSKSLAGVKHQVLSILFFFVVVVVVVVYGAFMKCG